MQLEIRLYKAFFCQKELVYLGHIITEDGYAPNPENVEKMVSFPSPKNLKETQKALGMVNFCRRFVPQFSKIAAPLRALTRKDNSFKWTKEAENALRSLIDRIVQAPILRFPILDGTVPFILTTDASSIAIAAAPSQVQNDQEHPIAFFSRSLNDTENKWGSTEIELAAIVAGVNHFRMFLLGQQFTIYTDNSACLEILKKPKLSPKLQRCKRVSKTLCVMLYLGQESMLSKKSHQLMKSDLTNDRTKE